jgi:hypothetical protein
MALLARFYPGLDFAKLTVAQTLMHLNYLNETLNIEDKDTTLEQVFVAKMEREQEVIE